MIYGDTYFAAILFTSPRSPKWKMVKALCEQADAVAEYGDSFVVAFHKKKESLQLLAVIADMVYTWKSAQIFVQRRKIAYLFSLKWLPCYFESLPCEHLAWCLAVTKAPKPLDFCSSNSLTMNIVVNYNSPAELERQAEKVVVEERFVCPCKKLSDYRWGTLELPSSLKDQFHAFAVEQGYAECPNFDIEHFKQLSPPIDVTPRQ